MESVAVYTGKSADQIQIDGGSGHWTTSRSRAKRAEYLICVRNRREQWSATDHKHGTAFLIAKVSGVKDSPHDGRSIITFSEYAEIDVPGAWKLLTDGQRFPVGYRSTEHMLSKLGVNPGNLEWRTQCDVPSDEVARKQESGVPISTIAEAKQQLARALGIPADSIEITIRA